MADRGHAQADQVIRRQLRQHLGVDIVVAERRCIALEAQAQQPSRNVHFFALRSSQRFDNYQHARRFLRRASTTAKDVMLHANQATQRTIGPDIAEAAVAGAIGCTSTSPVRRSQSPIVVPWRPRRSPRIRRSPKISRKPGFWRSLRPTACIATGGQRGLAATAAAPSGCCPPAPGRGPRHRREMAGNAQMW